MYFSFQFDVCKWLNAFRPKLADISQLLKFILQGLESWNQTDAVLIQGVSFNLSSISSLRGVRIY